jgi:hypothetical protein
MVWMIMNFKELKQLASQKNVKQDSAVGFVERLKAHEKKFEEKSKKLSPTDNFFARSYNL